ncbi:GntR family transcriptional regulator [Acrocarpospora sp. B8E8]|uniref:GntR family transcriptional regulator n=1 Tax=Acrocarpospora sp. B8E8 TaxID=3153572 RepID=UPI00325E39CD
MSVGEMDRVVCGGLMTGDPCSAESVADLVADSVAGSGCGEVAGILAAKIRGGELAPGAPFPRLWELMRVYGISRSLAALVQRELIGQGLIRAVGNGRVVVAGGVGRERSQGRGAGLRRDVLDRVGPVPLYCQIADILARMIEKGELAAGEVVPSESELARVYGVGRETARSVHRELRERGLAYTVGGSGTIVGLDGVSAGSGSRPVYVVIARELADQIRVGRIAPDRRIPSQQALMLRYGVSLVTARHAVGVLREAGWAYTVARRASYAARPERWPAREVWEAITAEWGACPPAVGVGRAESDPGGRVPVGSAGGGR